MGCPVFVVPVAQIPQPYTHVVIDRPGNRDGDGNSEDGMRKSKRKKIVIPKEESAGREAPDQRDWSQNGAGEMGGCEKGGRATAPLFSLCVSARQRGRKKPCSRSCCAPAQSA